MRIVASAHLGSGGPAIDRRGRLNQLVKIIRSIQIKLSERVFDCAEYLPGIFEPTMLRKEPSVAVTTIDGTSRRKRVQHTMEDVCKALGGLVGLTLLCAQPGEIVLSA